MEFIRSEYLSIFELINDVVLFFSCRGVREGLDDLNLIRKISSHRDIYINNANITIKRDFNFVKFELK